MSVTKVLSGVRHKLSSWPPRLQIVVIKQVNLPERYTEINGSFNTTVLQIYMQYLLNIGFQPEG